jgi:hypothetical protein
MSAIPKFLDYYILMNEEEEIKPNSNVYNIIKAEEGSDWGESEPLKDEKGNNITVIATTVNQARYKFMNLPQFESYRISNPLLIADIDATRILREKTRKSKSKPIKTPKYSSEDIQGMWWNQ